MKKKNQALIGGGSAAAATGTAVAFGGKTALWAIFSAGKGAALTGICETNAFLAWVGGGSIAAGGGGMALGSTILAALGPVGLTVAGAGAVAAGFGVVSARKNRKQNNNSK